MNAERTNAEELIRKLRENAYEPHVEDWQIFEWMMQSADLIESLTAENTRLKTRDKTAKYHVYKERCKGLTAQLTASQRRAQDARNELCQRCGRYKEAHKGACDGCRWKE